MAASMMTSTGKRIFFTQQFAISDNITRYLYAYSDIARRWQMNTLKTIDKEALKNRIAETLSEILSDKHDCQVTLRFVKKDQKRSENECTNA